MVSVEQSSVKLNSLSLNMPSKQLNGMWQSFLNKLYADLNQTLWTPASSDPIRVKARIPHFYYNYYVYQYSLGFAAWLKIVHGSQEDTTAISTSKAGKSDYPLCHKEKSGGSGYGKKTILTIPLQSFERRLNEFEKPLVEKVGLA